jgi:hypothetical protein
MPSASYARTHVDATRRELEGGQPETYIRRIPREVPLWLNLILF